VGLRRDGSRFHCRLSGRPISYQGKNLRVSTFLDVTELKKSENQLRESEEKFRKLSEASTDGIALHDRGLILELNRALAQMFGYEPSEMIGRHATEFADAPSAVEIMKKVQAGSEEIYEALGRRKDGSTFPVEIRGKSVTYQGYPRRIAVFKDISDRKRAETSIDQNTRVAQREREFSKNLIESNLDGILAYDVECRYTTWNSAMEQISGHSREQVLGRIAFEVFPFLKETGEDFYFLEALQGRTAVSQERPYRTPAGREGFFEGRYSPVRNEKGEIIGGLAVIRDITPRRRAEEALRFSESHLKALFESSSQAIVLIGKDLRIQAFNPVAAKSALQLQGMEYEIGQPFLNYILPQDRPRVSERFHQILNGESLRFERSYPGIDGSEHWFEINYNPVWDLKKKIIGICMISFSIDDRKSAEQALRESEEKFRKIFEDASMAMAMVSNFKFIKANRSFQELLGYSEEEITGKTLFDLTHPDDLSRSREIAEKIHNLEEDRFRTEKRYLKKDGQPLWLNISGTVIRDKDGQKIYSLLLLENIDDRKRAQEGLRKSEADLRAVFNSGTQMIALIGRDGRIREFNQNAARVMSSMAGKELKVGKPFVDYVFSDIKDVFLSRLHQVLEGEPISIERPLKGLDGAEHWFEFTYTPVQDQRGEITGLCMTASLIDKRKTAEQALRESEEGYRRLVDFTPEAVLVHDGEKIIFINPAGVKLFGFKDPEAAVHQSIWELIDPQSLEVARLRVQSIQARQEPTQPIDQKWRSRDGRLIDVEVKGIPFLYGNRPAILTIVRDITESKKNRSTLMQYERLAAVGKVIAAIAHEIRNPLAVVSGMSQLLKAKLENRSEFSSELDTILNQANRLKFFMNDILDYSRGLEIHKSSQGLGFLLEESLVMAQAQVGPPHATVQVEIVLDKELPKVSVDRDRLDQVLVNLLVNAYQAVEPGGKITLTGGVLGRWVVLRVEDNGSGILEQDLPRLFEPFFTTKKNGSGLGLSLSQKIIEAHGGKIEVQSVHPRGSCFILSLPLA
jgi:PAS domain S-box-containing protein